MSTDVAPLGGFSAVPPFSSEFRSLIEDLRAIIWQVDVLTHKFTWVSRHAEEVLGYPIERWLDEPGFWENHIHPEDRSAVLETSRQVVAEAQDHEFEYRMIAADGRVVWFKHIVRVVTDVNGKVCELRGVMVDITDRRVAEQALRETEERFRKIFEEGPIAMGLVGLDYRIKKVNQAFCTLLGYTEEEMRKVTFIDFTHPDDVPECDRMTRRLFAGEIPNYRIEKRYITKRGEAIWVDVFGTVVRDAKGAPLYGLGVIVDVSRHKHSEQALRELSTRLMRLQEEERRRIARELHDSAGQNLAALKLNLARLARARLSPELRAVVDDSATLADRMLSETRTLSHLLHPPLLDELGLASAVRSYVDGFSKRSGISVHLIVAEDFGRLTPELETAIFRIVQEGLTNAHRHAGAAECWVRIHFIGEAISLEIRDDGRGCPDDATANFGVGISGMRERARQLGGSLAIESCGRGCRIRAFFPAQRQ